MGKTKTIEIIVLAFDFLFLGGLFFLTANFDVSLQNVDINNINFFATMLFLFTGVFISLIYVNLFETSLIRGIIAITIIIGYYFICFSIPVLSYGFWISVIVIIIGKAKVKKRPNIFLIVISIIGISVVLFGQLFKHESISTSTRLSSEKSISYNYVDLGATGSGDYFSVDYHWVNGITFSRTIGCNVNEICKFTMDDYVFSSAVVDGDIVTAGSCKINTKLFSESMICSKNESEMLR